MMIIREIEEADQRRIDARKGRNRAHETIIADIELDQPPCSLKGCRLDCHAKLIARCVNNVKGGRPSRYISK
jgi:hypothetical protein